MIYKVSLLLFGFYRGFQRAMVKAMTLAAKIPHFHYVEEINCDALVELKESFQENSDPGVKLTFLPILIKSLSMALSRYPLLNSCFSEEFHEVTLKGLWIQIFYVLFILTRINCFCKQSRYIIHAN